MKNSNHLRSFTVLALCASALAFSLGAGCQGGAQTSSSTNWLSCEVDADCAVVAGAVCRSDSVCVDTNGQPIPASATSARDGQAGDGAAGDPDSSGTGVISSGDIDGAADTPGADANTASADAASEGALNMAADAGGGNTNADAANEADAGGAEDCPAGPPAANTACGAGGLVCQYAGSSIGVVATCDGGSWVLQQGGAEPSYVCPAVRPAEDSACPAPPTPAFSSLVCLFDCAGNGCQASGASNCGATQTDCLQDTQSGKWQWRYRPSNVQCPP
jgi:hypothetical protein